MEKLPHPIPRASDYLPDEVYNEGVDMNDAEMFKSIESILNVKHGHTNISMWDDDLVLIIGNALITRGIDGKIEVGDHGHSPCGSYICDDMQLKMISDVIENNIDRIRASMIEKTIERILRKLDKQMINYEKMMKRLVMINSLVESIGQMAKLNKK